MQSEIGEEITGMTNFALAGSSLVLVQRGICHLPFVCVPCPFKGRSDRRVLAHIPQPFRGRAAAQKAAGMDGNAAKKPVTAACYPLLSKPPDSVMIKNSLKWMLPPQEQIQQTDYSKMKIR